MIHSIWQLQPNSNVPHSTESKASHCYNKNNALPISMAHKSAETVPTVVSTYGWLLQSPCPLWHAVVNAIQALQSLQCHAQQGNTAISPCSATADQSYSYLKGRVGGSAQATGAYARRKTLPNTESGQGTVQDRSG